MNKIIVVFISMLFLQACGSDMSDTIAFIEKVKKSKGIAIEPMPETKPYKHFAYTASYLRSPFVAPQQELTLDVISQSRDCMQPDVEREKTLLEAYSLENLTMRGSLGDKEGLWALIETLDGAVYKVRKGHYVGLFHGQIEQVTEQQVEIIEIVPDGSGCWVERGNTIALNGEN